MAMEIGDTLPALTVPATGGRSITLNKDFAGRKLVLYFYPKDDTSGCTLEGQEFTALHGAFLAAGAEIVGVSKDSVKSHEKFCTKYGFPFLLLSDENEALCNAFGAIVEKSMYGKKYLGIERCTYLFGADGRLARIWRKVSARDHAAEVLAAVQAL